MTADRSPGHITRILEAINAGDEHARKNLFALVYDQLHRLARGRMAREKPGQTLQPTALVHEVYIRLLGNANPRWENRSHFFAAAAEAMRRILIEHARRRAQSKRGGGLQKVVFQEDLVALEAKPEQLLALDEALVRLETFDPIMSKVVMFRCFAGLTVQETAEALGISPRTVDRHWAAAKAWLQREVRRSE